MEKIKSYIIIGLLIALGIMIYLHTRPVEPVDDVTVTIPPVSGTSGDVVIKDSIIEVPVYIKDTKIIVDSTYKEKYEKAVKEKDSVTAKLLFLEAIQINEYNEVAVNDDNVKVDLYAKTRGSLLAYRVDYKIKEKTFTYTPEVVYIRPRLTLLTGVDLMLPNIPNGEIGSPDFKFDLGFQNKKGNVISVGYDTNNYIHIGYKQSFTLFK